MQQHVAALPEVEADLALAEGASQAPRRRFSIELDPKGLWLRLGRTEAYLCIEPEGAWTLMRETDGFDAQAWRLHLILGKVPN